MLSNLLKSFLELGYFVFFPLCFCNLVSTFYIILLKFFTHLSLSFALAMRIFCNCEFVGAGCGKVISLGPMKRRFKVLHFVQDISKHATYKDEQIL